MDMQMPEMNGKEATVRIRRDGNNFNCSTPIIALTANVSESDVNDCLKVGMNDFLIKPYEKINLIKIIHKFT
ncbi:MAG: hypothetical protein RJA07_927 [Bacteroidota bacterium]|jgi:CheY-like chemotaxis protein